MMLRLRVLLAAIAIAVGGTVGASLPIQAQSGGGVVVPTQEEFNALELRLSEVERRLDELDADQPTTTTSTTLPPSTTSTTLPPSNECAIAPADGEAAITAAIQSCPDGSTVRFPEGASYTQAHRILVADRHNLTIDGNGATFTSSANGSNITTIDSNFVFLRGSGHTVRNMTIRGDFTAYEGQPRSLGTIGNDPEFTQWVSGIGLYGTDDVLIEDVTILNQWADGVTTGPSLYVDAKETTAHNYTENVTVRRVTVETVGRTCWAMTSGRGVRVEDGHCSDAWYGGLSAEADGVEQVLRDHRYLRNTFDGYNVFGITVPVLTDDSGDFELRGNVFLTRPDRVCNAVILFGAYPDSNPRVVTNVTISENDLKLTHGTAMRLDHVVGGTVSGNTINLDDDKGCVYPNAVEPIILTNSQDVEVTGNTIT